MAKFHRQRKQRLRNFNRVWARNAYNCPEGMFWNVHPFADELIILETIAMKPEECQAVDFWWSYGVDVALVTIEANCKQRSLLLSAWGAKNPYPRVFAEIREPFVTSKDAPGILSQALQQGIGKRSFLKRFRRGR